MGLHLPLARVLRQLKSPSSNNITFSKDEILLTVQPPETATRPAEVRDYEGKMGKIEPRNYELIYDAFGIHLDPDAWGTRMQEMPDVRFTGPATPPVAGKKMRSLDEERAAKISISATCECVIQ